MEVAMHPRPTQDHLGTLVEVVVEEDFVAAATTATKGVDQPAQLVGVLAEMTAEVLATKHHKVVVVAEHPNQPTLVGTCSPTMVVVAEVVVAMVVAVEVAEEETIAAAVVVMEVEEVVVEEVEEVAELVETHVDSLEELARTQIQSDNFLVKYKIQELILISTMIFLLKLVVKIVLILLMHLIQKYLVMI